MAKDIGFAIVGLRRGYQAAREVTETAGATLVAVADLDTAWAAKVANDLGCEWTKDYHDLLGRDDVDVVGAWTPSGHHGDVCIDALRAGKHAVTTKPMEVTPGKCDAMIEAALQADRLLAVDFGSRYREQVRRVRRAIEAGVFGRLLFGDAHMWSYRSQYYYDKGGWRGSWAMDGGGSLMNQGVHSVDLLSWFMGPVERVEYARSAALTHRIETEDATQAMLAFANGAWGTILMTTSHYPAQPAIVHVAGEQGSAILAEGELTARILDAGTAETEFGTPPGHDLSLPPESDPPRNWAEDVVTALTKGTQVACDMYEGRRSVALNCAIYEAARTRKSVALGA